MPHPFGLREHYEETFASAGLATLYGKRVPEDQVWLIQRTTFEGSLATSGGNTRARLYIDGPGEKHYIFEQDGPSAEALYRDPDPIQLYPRERLALEWDQAQANTKLDMWLSGSVRVVPVGGEAGVADAMMLLGRW